jgi:cell division septation protein DedD
LQKKPNQNNQQNQTNMQRVSQEINFQPERTEIIDTTKEEDIPRYVLTNQPITDNPIGVTGSTQTPPQPTPTPATPPRTTPTQAATPQATNITQINQAQLQSGDFTAQFVSSRSREPVEAIQRKLQAANYNTEIQTANVNGVTMYRLRLAGSYTKDSAERLASEIQNRFSTDIKSYWVTTR